MGWELTSCRSSAAARQRRQHVRDAQLALADDLQLAAAQQLVVLQQTAGDRVLDGDHAQQRPVVPHPLELRLERPAGDDPDRFVAEAAPCGLLVEAPGLALNGYLFHASCHKKIPFAAERDSYVILFVIDSDHTPPFYLLK